MTARDFYLSVRVQSYAGGMLRRIGADLARQMRQVENLQGARASASITARRAAQQRDLVASQLQSIQGGKREAAQNLANARLKEAELAKSLNIQGIQARGNELLTARNALQSQIITAQSRESGVAKRLDEAKLARSKALKDVNLKSLRDQGSALKKQQLEAQARESMLSRRVRRREPLRGFTLDETRQLRDAARQQLTTLAGQEKTLADRIAIGKRAVQDHGLAVRKAAEDYAKASVHLQNLNNKLADHDRRIALNNSQYDAANTKLRNHALVTERAAAAEQEMAARARYLQAQLAIEGDAAATAAAKVAKLDAALASARGAEMRLAQTRTVEHAGRTVATVGAVGTVVAGIAAKRAADFQTNLMLAATQARPAGAPASRTLQINEELMKSTLDLLERFPATQQEVADGFYQIFSGTNIQSVGKATKELEVFEKMAVAGGASLDTMVQAGISLHNVFPGEFKNATDAANTFFAAVRYGRLNADQLANALGYVAPIAKDVGLNFRNVAGDIAFFTRQTGGRMTRQDAQGLARLYQLFARKDVSAGLAAKGIEVFSKSTGKMRPLVDILDEIRTKMHLTAQETINFFKDVSAKGSGKQGTQGTIQALRIFALGTQSGKEYRNVVNLVKKDNNEFIRSYEAMSQAPGVRWQTFLNQLRAMLIVVGQGAIPAFVKFGQYIKNLVDWFNNLGAGTRRSIGYFLAVISILTLLGGVILMVGGGLIAAMLATRLFSSEMFILRNGAAQGAASIGEFAAVAAGGRGAIKSLGDEAGTIRPLMVAGLGATLAIPILIAFHSQVGQVIGTLGGLRTILTAIIIILTAFSLRALLAQILTLTASLTTATGAALALKLMLLGINGLVVAATIIVFRKQMDQLFPAKRITPKQFTEGVLGQRNDWVGKGIRKIAKTMPPAEIAILFLEAKKGHELTPKQKQQIRDHYAALHKAAIRELHATQKRSKAAAESVEGLGFEFGGVKPPKKPPKPPPQSVVVVSPAEFKRQQAAAEAAKAAGVSATGAFMKLYNNMLRLQRIAAKHPESIKAQQDYLNARQKLEDNAGKQRAAAAIKAANAVIAAEKRAAAKALHDQKTAAAKAEREAKKAMADAKRANEKFINDQKQAQQQALQSFNSGVNTLMSTYQNALQQERQMHGELFQGPVITGGAVQNALSFGAKLSPKTLIRDITAQNDAFRRRNALFNQFRKQGAPEELITQLQNLDAEQIKVFENMSGPDWKRFLQQWKIGNRLIQNAAKADTDRQVRQWLQFGKNVAQAIITGISSQDHKMETVFRRMFARLFPGLTAVADVNVGGVKYRKAGPEGRVIPVVARMAAGGFAQAQRGTDTIPAMLTPGEVVLNKNHQRKIKMALGMSNSVSASDLFKTVQRFSSGGVVGLNTSPSVEPLITRTPTSLITHNHREGDKYEYNTYAPEITLPPTATPDVKTQLKHALFETRNRWGE